jgi:hypothetical protein
LPVRACITFHRDAIANIERSPPGARKTAAPWNSPQGKRVPIAAVVAGEFGILLEITRR